MAIEFELAGSQIDGARDYQEDAFLITHLTDADGNPSALVVVADGMGGHAAGNVASNMAVQAFNKHVSANYPSENLAEILEQSVINANSSIKETVTETPALAGMGCTMVAAVLEGGKITWASVGDSHCYLVRDKELTKLNADHSYGGFLDRMEAEGTPVEPEPGLSRNMLMSAITGEDINEIDVPATPFELQPGDRILLCSDGIDTLSAGKIIQYSEWSDSPKECSDALMQAVEEANMPRQDNTTAVVVNIKEASEESAAESAPATPEEEPVTEDVGESTAELPIVGSEPVEQQVGQPVHIEQSFESFEEPKSKTGMFIGIAAVVLILIGAGAFFALGKKPAVQTDMLVAETDTTEEAISEEIVEETEEATEETDTTVAEETTPETVEEKPVAKAESKPKATATTKPAGKSIQDTLKSGGKAPVMVVVPAGKFQMGSTSSRYSEERPRHEVEVKAFAVSQYEITFDEYDQFAKATGRKTPDSLYLDRKTHPVIFVTWDDAYYYTKWLSEETGEKYRLANEAEWEYLASTGKKTTFWWGYEEEPNRAHCFGCGSAFDPRKPTKVGSFEPNAFGIYDTAGNVSEWVHDCWHENYKGAPSVAEVWEGGDCAYRVARGGAYSTPPQSIRNSKRDKFKSDQPYDHIGIRVVRKIR